MTTQVKVGCLGCTIPLDCLEAVCVKETRAASTTYAGQRGVMARQKQERNARIKELGRTLQPKEIAEKLGISLRRVYEGLEA